MEQDNIENNLSDKQIAFCEHYITCFNATESAKRAGYSEDTAKEQGCRLLTNVHIRAYIQEKRKRLLEENKASVEYVINSLMEVADRCMQKQEVMEWDYGEKRLKPTGEYRFDSIGANKALELLGKTLGMYYDKSKNETEITIEKSKAEQLIENIGKLKTN